MYSCVFWSVNPSIQSFFFFLAAIVWPLSLFSYNTSYYEERDRAQTKTAKKTPTKSMNSHQKTQEYIKGPGWGGGGTPLQEANGDVPLDGITFSQLEWL